MIKAITNRLANFGRYIAAEPETRRRDPGTSIKTSDVILSDSKRRRVIEGGRELWRNYAVAAWAIRKHLDYVSTFSFQATNADRKLNQELENLIKWWGKKENCDVAAKHPLRRMTRLFEIRRTIDGDVFALKLNDGRLQAIEGDRVRNPAITTDTSAETWTHGIRTDAAGAAQSICVHKRRPQGGYEQERFISARNVYHLGYFDSFDQVRGVGPLTSAIANFQDSLEAKDYALAKAKVTQLFALAITREMADIDDDELGGSEYEIDFGRGPVQLDLDPGDKADFLESRHPSTEFQSFMTMVLQIALKSLDLPWSFYDEAYTNFFGSKAALTHYLQSCRSKRDDLKDMLDDLTTWRVRKWVARGVLTLPRGMSIDDLKWDWVHAGVPWWDIAREVGGEVQAIQAGLKTRSEVRRERMGDDWRDVMVKQAEEIKLMQELGLMQAATDEPQADQASAGESQASLKEQLDAYGLGVRSGAITPCLDDENHFRAQLGLPAITSDISTVWQAEPTRRPVTLAQGAGVFEPEPQPTQPIDQPPGEETETDDTDSPV